MIKFIIATAILTFAFPAYSQTCNGKCLTKDQLSQVTQAIQELDAIHKAPATLTFQEKIIIIQDWNGRVYINGGDAKPLQAKLKIGDTVDRDMAVTLPTEMQYRPKPPDPMFRLRIRAQVGILAVELADTIVGDKTRFWDAGIGWDFFHVDTFNVSAYTGVFSAGGGVGLDLTKNFGPYAGYSFTYDGFKSTAFLGGYFSFN